MVQKRRQRQHLHYAENDGEDNANEKTTTTTTTTTGETPQCPQTILRETVVDGGEQHQQAMLFRDKEERTPMTPRQRVTMYVQKHIPIPYLQDDSNHNNGTTNTNAASVSRRQYQVNTNVSRKCGWKFWKLKAINPDDFSYAPNGWAVSYINWTFRSGFGVVFLSFLLFFFFVAFLFGVLFKYAGLAEPQCIVVAGDEFGEDSRSTTLADGFHLSWTTFTTVGYGAVYTASGNDTTDQSKCLLITILCTAESFIGLLYAGICTAIMFGKIGRIQSHAQVIFSDALCIEFSKLETVSDTTNANAKNKSRGYLSDRGIMSARGVLSEIPMEHRQKGNSGSTRNHHSERVVRKSNRSDCRQSLGGVLNTHSSSDWRSTTTAHSHHSSGEVTSPSSRVEKFSEELSSDNMSSDDDGRIYSGLPKPDPNQKILCPVLRFQLVNQLANQPFGEILDAHMNVMVRKEQESYPYEPIARFLRVELEEPTHPFFNRVWHGRHVLDEHSPLVSVEARQLITQNNGYWPHELNSAPVMKHHLRFSSLIITMTGISNISAESVQIAKRYYRQDVLIGYNFAPVLFQKDNQQLYVDMSLVNDVIEQEKPSAQPEVFGSGVVWNQPAWNNKQQQQQQAAANDEKDMYVTPERNGHEVSMVKEGEVEDEEESDDVENNEEKDEQAIVVEKGEEEETTS